MLGDRGQGHLKGLSNICHGHIVLKQHCKNGAPGWVREGCEYLIKITCHADVLTLGTIKGKRLSGLDGLDGLDGLWFVMANDVGVLQPQPLTTLRRVEDVGAGP